MNKNDIGTEKIINDGEVYFYKTLEGIDGMLEKAHILVL